MPMAFVLIDAEVGSETEILEALKKIENVRESYGVYGTCDIIARVWAENMDELNDVLVGKIRGLKKVRSTTTLVVWFSQ